MSALTITELTPDDRSRWAELWRGYLDFYKTSLPDSMFDLAWSRLMAGTEIQGLGARTDHGLIGITHFMYHPHGWSVGPACYLQDLYVDAAVRGTGAGRALIEAVAARARAHGAERLYWMTQDSNTTARTLYDRLAENRGYIKYEYSLAAPSS